MVSERLFKPIKVGNNKLQHRLVMAPLTRFRGDSKHDVSPDAAEYYSQRANSEGTLLITEATFISPRAGGYPNIPGIYNDSHVEGWKKIVDSVHAKGSFIYLQLWSLGRVAKPQVLEAEGGFPVVGPSAIPIASSEAGSTPTVPVEMTASEIETSIQDYANATRNAIKAGFDGVEIHGANGYLVDQFFQDVSNQRSDKYGGSIENRARFGLEVAKACVEAAGDSKKVGFRLSPFGTFQSMGMKDPLPQFKYITNELRKLDLAYLHLVQSRLPGGAADAVYSDEGATELLPVIEAWGNELPVILAGGYTAERAEWSINNIAKADNILIAFGRSFISTPDLVFRIKHSLPLNKWDRSTFYSPGPRGYIDYPFSREFLAQL